MMTALMVSQILSWLLILAMGFALLALARQVGVLHLRVAPAGALTTAGGIGTGDRAAAIEASLLDGGRTVVGGAAPAVQGNDPDRQIVRAPRTGGADLRR